MCVEGLVGEAGWYIIVDFFLDHLESFAPVIRNKS